MKYSSDGLINLGHSAVYKTALSDLYKNDGYYTYKPIRSHNEETHNLIDMSILPQRLARMVGWFDYIKTESRYTTKANRREG